MPRSGKKSSTPTKSTEKKVKGQRYQYSELGKAHVTSSDPHHVYGVIVDASFPYKSNQSMYVCSLKVVDPSLHGSKNEYATVVIYGNRFEDLPIVQRVGDIIRLHRATLRLYNNQRQFNVSTHWNGSWALFSTEKQGPNGEEQKDFEPLAFSGKKASFEKHEQALLNSLRKWAGEYFSKHDGVPKSKQVDLKKASDSKFDFDVTAKILHVHEMDEYTNELKLRDHSDHTYYALALKLKFPHLRQGQVVRIRSATHDETSSSKKVLALSHYSNIMTFINAARVNTSVGKVSDDWAQEKAALAKDQHHVVVISEVEKKHQSLPFTSLNDLFHAADSLKGDTFRTCFTVTRVDPADSKEFVKSYDKKTKKALSAKTAKSGDLIW